MLISNPYCSTSTDDFYILGPKVSKRYDNLIISCPEILIKYRLRNPGLVLAPLILGSIKSVYIYIHRHNYIYMYIYIYRYVFFVDCVDFPPMSSTMAGSDTDFRDLFEKMIHISGQALL